MNKSHYGVATVSRIDKMIGLFCRILSLLYVSFAKETYNLIDPTKCSHPIVCCVSRAWKKARDSHSDKADLYKSIQCISECH